MDLATELRDLARRVKNNVPAHRSPNAFHEEKSEIEEALMAMARKAECRHERQLNTR